MEFFPGDCPYFHGICSAQTAENKLLENRDDSFLIRRNQRGEIIISYKTSRGKCHHLYVPTTKRSRLLRNNPHLLTTNHVINYILSKCVISLAYGLAFEEEQIPDCDEQTTENTCEACSKVLDSAKKLQDHVENNHRLKQASMNSNIDSIYIRTVN